MFTLIVLSVRLFTSFLFGSVGEIVTEKSGHLNLGTPGIMCFGGIGGCIGVNIGVNIAEKMNALDAPIGVVFIIVFSILFTILFSGMIGLLYSFLTVTLKANQNITGLAITTFGAAGANFISLKIDRNALIAASSKGFAKMLPLDNAPQIVQAIFGYGFLVYLAIILAVLVTIFFKRTKTGLGLRAVGENPATADAAGINVARYRYIATICGAAIAGFGGLSYIMDYNNGLFEQAASIETLGWLAVALVIFSVWKPTISIFGSLLFAVLYTLPYSGILLMDTTTMEVIKTLPYVVTILILVITSIVGKKQVQPPASLGINYFREDR